jgi:uncharacterized membrane protein
LVDLIIIVVLSMVLVPLVEFTSGALRIAVGLVFVLFSPGYTLIAALFPRKESLSGIERLALSFGLSIAVVPLIGLILNYTPWGIRLHPILISLLSFITAMAAVAWYRRQRLWPEERFDPRLKLGVASVSRLWAGQGPWDKGLTVLLVLAIVAACGALGYVIAKPKVGERFSEFYILGPWGKAEGYPAEVVLGQSGQVILGIENHEQEKTTYRIEVIIGGEGVDTIGPIILEHEGKWEHEVSFTPIRAGPKQKVEFWLYKGDSSDASLKLHLWVDVKETP